MNRIFNTGYKLLLLLTALILCLTTCKEPFDPPVASKKHDFLVVEGALNSDGGVRIKLSRTTNLNVLGESPEINAEVSILSEKNQQIRLNELSGGQYAGGVYPLINTDKYRLSIKTIDGKQYLSDFVTVKPGAAIDKVGWKRENGGVKIYVDTHDANNNTRYYRWEYEETWEFRTFHYSRLEAVAINTPRGITYALGARNMLNYPFYNTCWKSDRSKDILLANSSKLDKDIIEQQPLIFIPKDSWRLNTKYSILVRQYSLNKQSFEYWENIKKISENLGGIFSPMPSEVGGNIKCVTDSSEPVIGYFEASAIDEKRLFINASEVPDWNYQEECIIEVLPSNAANAFKVFLNSPIALFWVDESTKMDFFSLPASCVDCSLRGSPVRPAFWR